MKDKIEGLYGFGIILLGGTLLYIAGSFVCFLILALFGWINPFTIGLYMLVTGYVIYCSVKELISPH